MKAGLLDRRVALLKRSTVRNPEHGEDEVFKETEQMWAQVVPVSGRDFFAAAQTHNERTIRFRTRYRTDIETTDRLGYQQQQFNIVAIAELGRRDGLEITATVAPQ